uniref:Uncharacterized protein n=1 Tax=Brassica oleracea TaxID=3712 RepID=A0A3P6DC84_BRAOL|nr:unnamed protein product [Brassica oleracea]
MKRGFLGSSKKKPADSRTICKSTREESIDTLQAASIDSVNQKSIDNVHHQSIATRQTTVIDRANQMSKNTVHLSTVHLNTVHPDTVHPKNYKWDRFLASLDEEYMIPVQLLDDIMAKRDEQHGFGEPSKGEEAETSYPTSTSNDTSTSTSIDSKTTTSTGDKTSTSIDGSTQKSTDVSSCDLVPDLDREITMEDFLELEDEAQLEDMDQNSKKKLDDDQHTSRGDLETLKASIDRHQPDEIDRHPPYVID